MSAGKTERRSNFEIMRIVAILCIISFHYVYKAGWDVSTASLVNRVTIDLFTMLGELGVNLFVLASGYFLVKGRFSVKKLMLLMLEVWFYNMACLFASSGCDLETFFNSITLADVFPNVFGRYWFTTAYLILYVLSPYLSKGLLSLDRKSHFRLLMIMLFIWSLVPTVLGVYADCVESILYYNRLVWMIVVFCIAAYIRLYADDCPSLLGRSASFYIGCFLGLVLALLCFFAIAEKHPSVLSLLGIGSARCFWPPNTLVEIVLSVSLFMFFSKVKVPNIGVVNRIASTTLGIYLIHDGHLVQALWQGVFHNSTHLGSPFLVFHILSATCVVFIVGVVIDLIRQIPEKWISKGIDFVVSSIKGVNGHERV